MLPGVKNSRKILLDMLHLGMDAGTEWKDGGCVLIHGPVTGVRMWHTTYDGRIKLWVNVGYCTSLFWLVCSAEIHPIMIKSFLSPSISNTTEFVIYLLCLR